mmetsp:Transcript_15590/g.20968  ORF Transcript_15590/g.20968 Transcript_15590/m.20968 type:complete len:387 (-) Transcript_15590:820-1980(-)
MRNIPQQTLMAQWCLKYPPHFHCVRRIGILSEKKLRSNVFRLAVAHPPKFADNGFEGRFVFGRTKLNAKQHEAGYRASTLVMKERNVEAGIQRVQKAAQCARFLWELDAVNFLVRHVRAATGEKAHVVLREVVGAQVDGLKPLPVQCLHKLRRVLLRRRVHAVKHGRATASGLVLCVEPILELSYRTAGSVSRKSCSGEDVDEVQKAPLFFGDEGRQHGLSFVADVGSLRHHPQPIKVHVRPRSHRNHSAALHFRFGEPLFGTGNGKGARRLHDGAGVLEHVLQGSANFIVRDQDHLVHNVLRHSKRFFAHDFHRHAVGKRVDLLERHSLAFVQGAEHGVCARRLYANDTHARPDHFQVPADPCDEPAAADRDKNCGEVYGRTHLP